MNILAIHSPSGTAFSNTRPGECVPAKLIVVVLTWSLEILALHTNSFRFWKEFFIRSRTLLSMTPRPHCQGNDDFVKILRLVSSCLSAIFQCCGLTLDYRPRGKMVMELVILSLLKQLLLVSFFYFLRFAFETCL